MLDFSKPLHFDLLNHHLLLDKLQSCGLPAHILRWMATFLLDRAHRVKIGNERSHSGHPNGEVPQGTLFAYSVPMTQCQYVEASASSGSKWINLLCVW